MFHSQPSDYVQIALPLTHTMTLCVGPIVPTDFRRLSNGFFIFAVQWLFKTRKSLAHLGASASSPRRLGLLSPAIFYFSFFRMDEWDGVINQQFCPTTRTERNANVLVRRHESNISVSTYSGTASPLVIDTVSFPRALTVQAQTNARLRFTFPLLTRVLFET